MCVPHAPVAPAARRLQAIDDVVSSMLHGLMYGLPLLSVNAWNSCHIAGPSLGSMRGSLRGVAPPWHCVSTQPPVPSAASTSFEKLTVHAPASIIAMPA